MEFRLLIAAPDVLVQGAGGALAPIPVLAAGGPTPPPPRHAPPAGAGGMAPPAELSARCSHSAARTAEAMRAHRLARTCSGAPARSSCHFAPSTVLYTSWVLPFCCCMDTLSTVCQKGSPFVFSGSYLKCIVPCACPRWGATCLLHEAPNGSRCHQETSTRPHTSHLRHSHRQHRGERIKQGDKIEKLLLRRKGRRWRHLALLRFVFVVDLLDLPAVDSQPTCRQDVLCHLVP